jgi:hypothetical protein
MLGIAGFLGISGIYYNPLSCISLTAVTSGVRSSYGYFIVPRPNIIATHTTKTTTTIMPIMTFFLFEGSLCFHFTARHGRPHSSLYIGLSPIATPLTAF